MTIGGDTETTDQETVVLLGTEEDVLGFSLAGVSGTVCATPRDVKRALAAIDARAHQPALLLVSATVEQMAPRPFADRWLSAHGPVVVVLP